MGEKRAGGNAKVALASEVVAGHYSSREEIAGGLHRNRARWDLRDSSKTNSADRHGGNARSRCAGSQGRVQETAREVSPNEHSRAGRLRNE